MSTARAQKKRVESLAERTPSTATFANPDGTWTTEAYSGVVRSRADEDKWVAVDPTIESAGKGFAPKAVPYDVVFSEGGDKNLATLSGANGKAALTLGWPTRLPQSMPKGDTLTFQDAADAADLVLTSMPEGFNFSLVLEKAPTTGAVPIEYRVPLNLAEGRFVPGKDGSFEVRKDGKTLATMTAPVMWDSADKIPAPVGRCATRRLWLGPDTRPPAGHEVPHRPNTGLSADRGPDPADHHDRRYLRPVRRRHLQPAAVC